MTVQVSTGDGELVVSISGLDAVWALKRRIRVSLDAVERVEVWQEPFQDRWTGWRLPGTAVPGFRAGSYLRRGAWRFYVARAGTPALVVALHGHRYDRLVLRTADPDGDRELVRSARAAADRPV